MSTVSERRRFPRIQDNHISMKLEADGVSSVISQSLNISASGVYCKLEHEIPLLSRVKVIIMLPKKEKAKRAKTNIMEVDGVVVREHPVIENGKVKHYDVAIFFDSLSAKDRENIKAYINSR